MNFKHKFVFLFPGLFVLIGILIFPILFVYASKNLDAKGVFEWMMEKPNDWIGKK